jgi:hypothetical protein
VPSRHRGDAEDAAAFGLQAEAAQQGEGEPEVAHGVAERAHQERGQRGADVACDQAGACGETWLDHGGQ